MSFAYGRTVSELQQIIDSQHFTELLAYKNRNTTSPPLAWLLAQQISLQAAGVGVMVEPADLMPGGPSNVDEVRKRQAELAERSLDARSKE